MNHLKGILNKIAKEGENLFNRSNKKCVICGKPAIGIHKKSLKCFCDNQSCIDAIEDLYNY